MKRGSVIVAAFILCMVVTGTASASKPVREVIPVDDTFEAGGCGFAVLVHHTGTIIRTTHTEKDGSLRIHESYPGFRWFMTNESSGASIVVGIPGPGTTVVNADGSGSLTGTGPWSWFGHPETGEPGIFLTKGRFVQTFDDQGNQMSFSLVGTTKNLCAELEP